MIICPNCQNQETDGAIFCSKCGAMLNAGATITTHKIVTAEAKAIEGTTKPFEPISADQVEGWISLHMMESGQIIPLADRTEFTLGRASEGQPVMPDIDLAHYDAYANGVSRLHAVIKCSDDHVCIIDLDSSNGTYINGERIVAHKETPLRHGDLIHLGKLKIQILIGQAK